MKTLLNEELDLLTTSQLARKLKKPRRTIQHWSERGLLPFIWKGDHRLYNWDLIVQVMNLEVQPPPPPPQPRRKRKSRRRKKR